MYRSEWHNAVETGNPQEFRRGTYTLHWKTVPHIRGTSSGYRRRWRAEATVTVTAHPPQLVPKRKRQLEVLGRERRCLCPHDKFHKMLKGSLIVEWGGGGGGI